MLVLFASLGLQLNYVKPRLLEQMGLEHPYVQMVLQQLVWKEEVLMLMLRLVVLVLVVVGQHLHHHHHQLNYLLLVQETISWYTHSFFSYAMACFEHFVFY